MREDIELRVLSIAKAMIKSGATVRALAREYGVSKSTVHKDMAQRLQKLDPDLYDQVRAVLKFNKAERHIRGGMATSLKYRLRREKLKTRGGSCENRRSAHCENAPHISATTRDLPDRYRDIFTGIDDFDLPDENAVFPR